ncbi:MAG: type II toxin-antitoxin system RelE/ParE family toxin [Alphaproteobacteria bacterium]|nr:MAG: type II toxin-antitoxin system RelE/ParE family toxin [Alphaproteobacteria bacterium]
MTTGVVYSRRAAAEAEEIEAFLAEHSRSAAERLRQSLNRAEQRLVQFPDSGAPGARPGTRRLVVGNYIVSYRRRGDDVEIFAVRDARRRDARF